MLLKPGSRPVPNCPDYILVRELGAGAFGQVWHGHGPGGLDVALKFIRLDSQFRAVELRSIEVMKGIRHPNLVSLFGAWHQDDWLILAMELCDGTLLDRLAEALDDELPGIPLEELLNYMADAAKGLDALNAKQVQHRDVKPANLLLLDSGVKVADFGLAKALEQTVASNSGAGTIAYLAPECFNGELTQQSDQYSLAVTYYHLRTGRLLFEGNQAQVMYAHVNLEPDLSDLPPAEGIVLARALSKEPRKRWANCKAFVNELVLIGAPVKPPASHVIADLAKAHSLPKGDFWNRFHRTWGQAGQLPNYVKDNWSFMMIYVQTLEKRLKYQLPELEYRLAEAKQRVACETPFGSPQNPVPEQLEQGQDSERQMPVADMLPQELKMELLEQPFRTRHPLGIGFWDCIQQERGKAATSSGNDNANWMFLTGYVETLEKYLTAIRERLSEFGLKLRSD